MTTHQGRCLCGAVQFSVEVSRKEIDCCHCSMCRKAGGGPALTVFADGAPRFEDEAALGIYRSSEWGERLFCKTCGTGILWRSVDGRYHTVPVALIGDPEDLPLTTEIFIDDKPGYLSVRATASLLEHRSYALAGERTRMTGAELCAAFGGDPDAPKSA